MSERDSIIIARSQKRRNNEFSDENEQTIDRDKINQAAPAHKRKRTNEPLNENKRSTAADETIEVCTPIDNTSFEDISFEQLAETSNGMDDINPLDVNSNDKNKANDLEEKKPERKKYTSYNWVRETVFPNFEDAVKFLEQQNFVQFKETESERLGLKMYFRCKLIPKDWPTWCTRQYMVHCPHDCLDAIVYHNDMNHNHDELIGTKTKRRLSKAMIEFMNELFDLKTTQYPSIIQHIENARKKQNLFINELNPTKDQVSYRLKLFRDKDISPILNLGELMSWCKTHSTPPNTDEPHAPFVLDYWRERNNGTGLKFRFVFTTLYLLNLFKSVDKVCIDSTYKLNWNEFPLTILGTIDRNKKFHPIAFACTTNETADDYAFVFNAVKTKIKQFFSTNFEPTILISDAADAIRNAFYKIFPNAIVDIMCFAHVLRNVDKRKFSSKNNKKLIKEDIRQLQQAPDKKTFTFMSTLFCAKWRPIEAEFITYFEKQWLGVHCNWYEGASIYTPSTNNAQEAVNGVIKKKVTLRKRLPMNQFMTCMANLISDVSKELCNGSREFAGEPFIETGMWKEAILMQQNSFKSFKLKQVASYPDHLSFTVPSSTCSNPTVAYYKTLSNQKWKSFDEFIQHGFQQFYLVHVKPTNSWKRESICMCTSFLKQYICKHIIAIALREELTECPDEDEPMLLSRNKRNAGRSKNAEPALVVS